MPSGDRRATSAAPRWSRRWRPGKAEARPAPVARLTPSPSASSRSLRRRRSRKSSPGGTLPSSPPGYPAAAKSGIRVNAVAPGPTDTGMLTRFTGTPESKAALVAEGPMRRLSLPDELANAIVVIASAEDELEEGARQDPDEGEIGTPTRPA